MEYDEKDIITLRKVLSIDEIALPTNEVRRILEDKLDKSRKYILDIRVDVPDKDIIICKEDVSRLVKVQKAYNIFMETFINKFKN
jgi:hypothetical protein